MVVPHVGEGPAGARILKIGIVQIRAINRAIVVDRRRNVEIVDLFAVRIADNIAEPPIVHALRPVFRIPDEFVDEVAEMQHKAEPIWFGGVLILVDHPSISILRSIVCVLATDKSEPDRSGIVIRRRSDGAANAAAESVCIGEAVPVNVRRLQAAD